VSEQSKRDAFDTLYTVLVTFTQVAAPLLPYLTEEMYRGLVGDPNASVHLHDWPDTDSLPGDPELVAAMDRVREVCSVALSLREDHRLRARLPLRTLTVAGPDVDDLAPLVDLIRDEVNVKEVVLTDDVASAGSFVLRPDARVLGPRLGKDVQAVIRAAKAGEWVQLDDGAVEAAGHILSPAEFDLALDPRPGAAASPLRGNDAVVELDVEVTDDLAAEGMARDVVRLIQQARKDAELDVTDRIRVELSTGPNVSAALDRHADWVAEQVLAVELTVNGPDGGAGDGTVGAASTATVDGEAVSVAVTRL
jgi:isoleucyl-tRNA synthetase